MYKTNKSNKSNKKNKTNSKKTMKTKRKNSRQKIITQLGGTKADVCDEMVDLKRFGTLDIFNYALQIPKISNPLAFADSTMVGNNIKTFIDKSVSYNSSSKLNSKPSSKPSSKLNSKPNKGSVNVTKILETLEPNEASKLQDYLSQAKSELLRNRSYGSSSNPAVKSEVSPNAFDDLFKYYKIYPPKRDNSEFEQYISNKSSNKPYNPIVDEDKFKEIVEKLNSKLNPNPSLNPNPNNYLNGIQIQRVGGDGNCFFSSIANQLNQIGHLELYPDFNLNRDITQQAIRNAIVNYYLQPGNIDELIVQATSGILSLTNTGTPVTANDYIASIGSNGWGGEKEIAAINDGALSELTNGRLVLIDVYNYNNRSGNFVPNGVNNLNRVPNEMRRDRIPVLLLYNGANHYDRLYFDNGNPDQTRRRYREYLATDININILPLEEVATQENITSIQDMFPDMPEEDIKNLLNLYNDDINETINQILQNNQHL